MISIIVKILRFIGFNAHRVVSFEISKESWDRIIKIKTYKGDTIRIFDDNNFKLIINIKK